LLPPSLSRWLPDGHRSRAGAVRLAELQCDELVLVGRYGESVSPRRKRREPDDAQNDAPRPTPDRSWSARRSINERDARADLVAYTALPAETGPTWAPDRLSVWPVEGGRFGLDAHYEGATGAQRADYQAHKLAELNLRATVQQRPSAGTTLRLGPLTHEAAWVALEAFLGRPPPRAPGD
jgi:hypothetical protein